ncbi:LysR family transcriptional regulator [Pseudodesulfovibrio cashew]|uniref:LysR family transcriptional regulator n=1 Tax=Pseudodesulfovibrio cashew TaxID=2678688 RepID=A0A6I6JVU8_9BACT|nr:LysR family transcriptional regulator [Pseudodesulfovibrio cashew]QGY41844.1 LysR family transcriptional regulator [Pseudodesulfovibrio cashew]
MKSLPPLKPLISFRSAARNKSFTKAAHELNLTQGAISRAVKQLEEFFGFELFERRNRGLFLTGKGKQLAEGVEEALVRLERVSEAIRLPETKRRLSVSCEPSLAMRWLMPKLETFLASNPHTDIHLSTGGGPIDLSAEGVHLAIRRSDFAWPPHYHCTPLGRERIGPVCSPEYWAQHKNGPKQRLHTRTRPEAWSDWDSVSTIRIDFNSEKYFDHFYFSLQAATTGFGMAIGPEPMVRDDIKQGLLVAPYGFETTRIEYVTLSLDRPGTDNDMNAFINWLKAELSLPTH